MFGRLGITATDFLLNMGLLLFLFVTKRCWLSFVLKMKLNKYSLIAVIFIVAQILIDNNELQKNNLLEFNCYLYLLYLRGDETLLVLFVGSLGFFLLAPMKLTVTSPPPL